MVDHNASLMCPISLEEMEAVVMSMAWGKSPMPNGFTTVGKWLKLVWDLVFEIILGVLLALNATFLVLVPKEDKVTNPSKFHHLSL
jgi:hypothetical protein